MSLKYLIPPTIFEHIEKAGISTPKQILMLSVWDISRSTNLGIDDIMLLKDVVSDFMCPDILTGNGLINNEDMKLPTGCKVIDSLLNGGLRRGTITEIFGESGCGKTQLALQITLNNICDKNVYICTEDLFPTKRFEEIKRNLPNFDSEFDYGNNVFVEHITESQDLLSCIRVRLPKLIAQNKLSLIVIDSVAAPFRCETTNYVKRAEDLRELAIALIVIAQKYNIAILCINQVTASFEDSDNVLPCLGLAWSNMISTRLMIKKTLRLASPKHITNPNNQQLNCRQDIYIRELIVQFAPDLPNAVVEFVITSNGIQSI